MTTNLTTAAAAAVSLSFAGAANAAIDVHVTGSTWGVWVTGLFSSIDNPDGSTHHALSDNGSGVPMDFMISLPDGTSVDGTDVTMRMLSADTIGDVGAPEIELASWSLWINTNDFGLHVIWNSSSEPLTLSNIGSSGQDGVDYAASGLNESLQWTLDRADGTSETFSTDFQTFEFTAPIPAPAGAALLTLGGLAAARRRR